MDGASDMGTKVWRSTSALLPLFSAPGTRRPSPGDDKVVVSIMDDDDWQEMPVVHSDTRRQGDEDSDSDSEAESSSQRRFGSASRRHQKHPSLSGSASAYNSTGYTSAPANATGRSLNIDDARGYDWRSKPVGAPGMHTSRKHGPQPQDSVGSPDSDSDSAEDSDEKGKGYTQLRLDEDVEGDELHAATEYLFGDSQSHQGSRGPVESSVGYSYQGESNATPLSQMMTTKSLLSEAQKIAYVGLCALQAKELVRAVRRAPGSAKDLAASLKSIEEWELRVMARLFQHMDISASGECPVSST